MLAKRLFPLFVFSVCVFWLGAKARADESPLSEMDPDVAKEYGGKIAEQFNKENKDLPVKIVPDADKAVGLVNADTNEGILLVPLKGFREETEGPKDAEKDRGIGLCYIFMSPSYKPLADGKAGRRQAAADHEVQGQRGERARHALPDVQRQARRRG